MNRDGQTDICYHSLTIHLPKEFNRLSLQLSFAIHLLSCSLVYSRFYLWIHIIHLHHLIIINQPVLFMIRLLHFYLNLILIPIRLIRHHPHPIIIIQFLLIIRPHLWYSTTIPQPIFIHRPLIQLHQFISRFHQQLFPSINQLLQH